MKITLLGTGDAIGTPKIGCSCPQCTVAHTTGTMRLRTSLLIEHLGAHLVLDTSPDLRQQLLKYGSPRIDAAFWSHGHYDHFMGFGEFYRIQNPPPVYAPRQVMEYCAGIFSFLPFEKRIIEPYVPFTVAGLRTTAFEVRHPPAYTCGFLFETGRSRVAFTSDTNIDIPDESLALLEDLDLLLLDALVPPGVSIHKHMNYQDACTLAGRLRPKEFCCIHQSHLLPWDLPHLGRDGQVFELA